MKKIIFSIFITFILGACSQQGQSVATSTITLEDVKTALKEQGIELNKIDLPENNVFIREIEGESPKAYSVDDTTLSIYTFSSTEEREKGMEAFEEANAAASLEPYKTFTVQNVLVFYIEGEEEVNNKLNTAIAGLG